MIGATVLYRPEDPPTDPVPAIVLAEYESFPNPALKVEGGEQRLTLGVLNVPGDDHPPYEQVSGAWYDTCGGEQRPGTWRWRPEDLR